MIGGLVRLRVPGLDNEFNPQDLVLFVELYPLVVTVRLIVVGAEDRIE